jgi:hypothetical protein
MRKRILDKNLATPVPGSQGAWRDLAEIATVEVTSEDPQFPIESAFTGNGPGWRASEDGTQRVRLIFDEPIGIRRIQLRFEELGIERTQEFSLQWSAAHGGACQEIIRQQWNFSPHGSTAEVEDYTVELEGVSVLELAINPDISGRREVAASMAAFLVK